MTGVQTCALPICVNKSGDNYIYWSWKGGGNSVVNSNGTITSNVSVNTTSGFSVVAYTSTGSNATVGHGLNLTPSFIIAKGRSTSGITNPTWPVYHVSLGANAWLDLYSTAASTSASTVWQNVTPTSSVFSIGTANSINTSSGTQIAYCFAPIAGYSAFGSYTGNGSTDGPFVYLGFRPRWLTIKCSSSTDGGNGQWLLYDSSRSPFNSTQDRLWLDSNAAE